MGLRIGADIGGTFTDLVLELDDGSLLSNKVLTDHEEPEQGILSAVVALLEENGLDPAAVEQIVHGTTLATNALIERRGAYTALVTTAGFRDVIETRTEGRFEQYDLNLVQPTPLIERRDRYVISERINARGELLSPFDESSASEVIDQIEAAGYEAVAVGFIHSYRNPDHERRFGDMLSKRLPQVAVSLSSAVSPQMREYERFNTVCANAYVQPLMASYLLRLRDGLAAIGIKGQLYMIHSGGGLMSVETAAAFPVRLIESGPAGGAIFAADLAARYGREKVISYDMGGTTAKIALIEAFTPQTAKTFEVARTMRFKKGSGMPISIPVIEMIEIGAGGGSIASVDSLGRIQIGPHSAGSEPGPAAYDLGGSDPTVTDANLQLGRLHPDTFGAKTIQLSADKAKKAIEAGVGSELKLDPITAAVGILEVVDENMTNAARVHAVENGKNLSGFSLIAFGGGAPLHASHLMDKLGVEELLVPPCAGVGSAVGFLKAPFSYEALRSFYTTISAFDHIGASEVLTELEAEAVAFVRRGTTADVGIEASVAMRYQGQGWEIPVLLPAGVSDDLSAETLAELFIKSYEGFFGRAIDGVEIEVVSWSVRVASLQQCPQRVDIIDVKSVVEPTAQRQMYDPSSQETLTVGVLERDSLEIGDGVVGPAVIAEPQTSTILGSRHLAVVQPDSSLRITHRE